MLYIYFHGGLLVFMNKVTIKVFSLVILTRIYTYWEPFPGKSSNLNNQKVKFISTSFF